VLGHLCDCKTHAGGVSLSADAEPCSRSGRVLGGPRARHQHDPAISSLSLERHGLARLLCCARCICSGFLEVVVGHDGCRWGVVSI
jgi:hypothetical protein